MMQMGAARAVIMNRQRLQLYAVSIRASSALITDFIRARVSVGGAVGVVCLVAAAKTGRTMTLNVITVTELDLSRGEELRNESE
jgi:hypothetical protein